MHANEPNAGQMRMGSSEQYKEYSRCQRREEVDEACKEAGKEEGVRAMKQTEGKTNKSIGVEGDGGHGK